MFNLNKEIARHICLAQTASDAGKGLNILSLEGDKRAKLWGYSLKDKEIIKAISLINSSKITECQFRYYVVEMPDQNGNKSRVVYFYNTQEKIQISFHTFCGEIWRYIRAAVEGIPRLVAITHNDNFFLRNGFNVCSSTSERL